MLFGDEQHKKRVIFPSRRVVVRAQPVDVVVQLPLRSGLRPVEKQVLEEVRRSGGLGILVDDTRADDDRGGDHRVRMMRDQNDTQAVLERLLGGTTRCRGHEDRENENVSVHG